MERNYLIEQPLAWFEPDDYFYDKDKINKELDDEQDTDLQKESEEDDNEHTA